MNNIRTIVIDPGHGGSNEGTTQNGFLEKDMTLITAKALYDELTKYDELTVYMTRTKDKDMDLASRAEYAASVNADMLISVHYNATLDGDKYGSEIWVPLDAPNHMTGYRFGEVFLQKMQDLGMFVRGIKTRESEDKPGLNYYGIIRAGEEHGIPTVILEHCHVDMVTDAAMCDSTEELQAFGKADAQAVLEFVGLEPMAREYDSFSYNDNTFMTHTAYDLSAPEMCEVSLKEAFYDEGKIEMYVSAMDSDSPLLYFDYSLDGGFTYGELRPWPQTDPIANEYADSFTLTIPVEGAAAPKVCVRAYNMYDVKAESNVFTEFEGTFKGESSIEEAFVEDPMAEEEVVPEETPAPTKAPEQMIGGKDGVVSISLADTPAPELSPQMQGFLILSIGVAVCIILASFFALLRTRLHKKGKNKRK